MNSRNAKSNNEAIRAFRPIWALALPLLALLVAGCSETTTGPPPADPWTWEDFKRSDFDANSINVTNPYLPLEPGKRYTYHGNTVDDTGNDVFHKVVINVTNLTKMINGVNTVVSWDLDYSGADSVLVERELAFFAQDMFGNVWRMGEHPEEFEQGVFVANPTWIGGIAGAVPGISMLANPTMGTPEYSQGWGPAVDFTDRGRVDATGMTRTVAAGTYMNVVRIAERSRGEAGEQLKYFAPGVGNVEVGWRGDGSQTREKLDLTSVETLCGQDLVDMNAQALLVEESAKQKSPFVYGITEDSVARPDIPCGP